MSDYNRIAQAMAYLSAHASRQPSLEEVAAHVHLSAFHFQRMCCRWAGTTPKRFLQALTLQRGKRLVQDELSLMDVSHRIGLSGSSRLHDHFVTLEAVTPGEFRKRGQGVTIEYGVHDTPLGGILVAVTPRGVCRMAFLDDGHEAEVVDGLRKDWPQAELARNDKASGHVIAALFSDQADQQRPLSVQVEGTNFQIAVWRALLNIPPGKLASYSQIARALGCPKASRAVGNA
ncbi:MAG TPA: 6-O-methylguanine DNA methyltransferase, partial [Marinobacter sp.]|nr:6-O-methylguanine DNA methyltransferase [Marinobacter sp.]